MKNLKKYILGFVLMLISIPSIGQQTIIVGYGETFESIANKYDITISDLQAANSGKNVCYAGMKIIIPQPSKSPVGDNKVSSPVIIYADSLLLVAKKLSSQGLYKKAIKIYNNLIDMNVRTPYAYAGRGECNFCLKKYKKAKTDLNHAINSGKLAEIEKDWCEDALEDVEKAIVEKRERNNAIFSKIGLTFAATAAVAATAYVASEQAKMQNQYYQNSVSTSPVRSGEGSSHLSNADRIIAQSNADIDSWRARSTVQLNQMTNQAMFHAQTTNERMNRAFKEQIEWMGEFSKKNGRQPTEYETDQWYATNYPDLLETRILARGKMYEESNGDDIKENEDSRTKTDYSKKFENRYSSGKQCISCLGSGKCQTCNGNGWYNNPILANRTVICPNCDRNHNGICSHCHGTGKNP